MAVDAGTIYSEVRVELNKLNGDVRSVVASFDEIANKSKMATMLVSQSWDKVQVSIGNIDKTYQGLKGTYDTVGQKQQALLSSIKDLIDKGVDPENQRVLALKQQYNDLQTQSEKTTESTGAGWNKLKIAAIAAFGAITLAVKAFVKGSIDEYLTAEESSTRLSMALRSGGEYSKYAAVQAEAYAKELQGVTKYEDEATQDAMSLLMSLGGLTRAAAESTIPAVQDLATALGMDLSSAATLVSKAADGNMGMLKRYGITITDTGDKTQNLAAITKALEDRFGGLAQAVGDTASGKLVQLKNAFADVKEEIGRSIVDAVKPFVAWVTEVTKGIGASVKAANDLREALRNQAKGIADTNDQLIMATAKFNDVNTRLHNFTDTMWLANNAQAAMSEATSHGFGSIEKYVKFLLEQNNAARAAMNGIQGLAEREQEKADATAKQAKDLQDYLDKVDETYAKTGAGAQAALEQEIAYWEHSLKTAVATKPQVMAILEDLKKKYAELTKATDEGADAQKAWVESYNAEQKARLAGEEATLKASVAAMEARNKASESLMASTDDYNRKLEDLGKTELEMIDISRTRAIAEIQVSNASDEAKAAEIAALNAYYNKLKDTTAYQAQKKAVEDYSRAVMKIMSELFSAINAGMDREVQAEKDKLDKILKADQEALDKKIKAENAAIDKITNAKLDALDVELQARLYSAGLATAATEEQYRAEIAAALAAGDRELAAELQRALDTLLITRNFEIEKKAIEDAAAAAKLAKDQADQAAKEALDLAAAKKKAKLEYDAAMVSWNFKWILALADTASAIVEALPNIPLSIAAGILGAIQVLAIVAAKPRPPSLQTGGIVLPSGSGSLVRVAENGAPELLLNGGASGRAFLRAFARELAGEMRGGGTIVVQSVLDGRVIAESSARYYNKGITRLRR